MNLAALTLALLLFGPTPPAFRMDAPAPVPEAYTAGCSAQEPIGCVERVYASVYEDRPLTLGAVVAMTAVAELGLFYDLGHAAAANEALWRSWFDSQSGACPSGYNCSYANIIAYLTTSQVWRDSIHDGAVDLRRLLGGSAERYLDYLDPLAAALAEHDEWYTGQGADVPSSWGGQVIEPGAVSYDWPSYAAIITHVYASGGWTFDEHVRADELPVCSYYSAIVDIENRFRVSTCGDARG